MKSCRQTELNSIAVLLESCIPIRVSPHAFDEIDKLDRLQEAGENRQLATPLQQGLWRSRLFIRI